MSNPVPYANDGSDAAVAAELAELFARPGSLTMVLAGGTTPAAILARCGGLDWARACVWPADERVVPADAPADHPARNGSALRRAIPHADVLDLVEGAVPPAFDLVWAGMGADGHVASIFLGMDLSDDEAPRVAAVTPDPLPPEAPYPRLTLTMAALLSAPHLWIVARGSAKRAVLDTGDPALPIHRLLARARGRATVFWSET